MTVQALPPGAVLALAARAAEQREANPLIHDPAAAAWLASLGGAAANQRCDTLTQVAVCVRAATVDAWCRELLQNDPDAVPVELGVGFSTRAWRLGLAPDRFIGVDQPIVITARQRLAGRVTKADLAADVTEPGWLDVLNERLAGRPAVFIAEGLLPFLARPSVDTLLTRLAERHPQRPLLFDAYARSARPLTRLHPGLRRAGTPVRFTLHPAAIRPPLHILERVTLTDHPAALQRLGPLPRLALRAWPAGGPWAVVRATLA